MSTFKSKPKSIISNVANALNNKKEVKINDFGTFRLAIRKERIGRNPQTKEEILIPSSTVPVFKASKFLKDKVNDRDFIERMFANKKISEEEERVLKYIYKSCKELKESHKTNDELFTIEVENIAKDLKLSIPYVQKVSNQLIDKRILNTMVYYGETDSVYLRADYRKFV